jgi:hypothetical protein
MFRKFILLLLIFTSLPAHASKGREFLLSCTYGTLAGTLVGAASLAFTSQPSEKLYRVARGASLGLYAGIILGTYVTQFYRDPALGPYPDEQPNDGTDLPQSMLWLTPTYHEARMDGAQMNLLLGTF